MALWNSKNPCFQELVPPQYRSSDGESSDDEDLSRVGLDTGEWAFDLPPPMSEDSDPDMSDLWVVEDGTLLSEKKGRKHSFLRYSQTSEKVQSQ